MSSNKNQGMYSFELCFASSATEALEATQTQFFQVILLDVLMPAVNGYAVIPALRRVVGDNVPIVMISAHSHVSA